MSKLQLQLERERYFVLSYIICKLTYIRIIKSLSDLIRCIRVHFCTNNHVYGRFGTRAKFIRNKPKVHVGYGGTQMDELIKRKEEEVARLRDELNRVTALCQRSERLNQRYIDRCVFSFFLYVWMYGCMDVKSIPNITSSYSFVHSFTWFIGIYTYACTLDHMLDHMHPSPPKVRRAADAGRPGHRRESGGPSRSLPGTRAEPRGPRAGA